MSFTRILLTATLALVACGGATDSAEPTQTGAPTGTASGTPVGAATGTATGDTWDTFAADFMQTYCVACHETSPKDFTAYADVVAWADKIRCGTTPVALADCNGFPPPGQFPIGTGPMPTDGERERLVAWIEAGLPN